MATQHFSVGHAGHCTDGRQNRSSRTANLNVQTAVAGEYLTDVLSLFVSNDLTLVNDNDSVTNCLYLGKDVSRQNNGMILTQCFDQITDLDDLLRVQTDSRLVENNDLRIAYLKGTFYIVCILSVFFKH